MHKLYGKIIAIVSLSFVLSTTSTAQYYEAGGGVGLLAYWGDLNTPELETNINNSKLVATIFLKYNFNGYLGLKTSLFYGNIAGDDSRSDLEWQTKRNLSFKSTFTELSVTGEISPFKYDAKDGDQMFTPYLSIGLSVFHFNPKTLYFGKYYDLQPLGTEGQGINGKSKYSLISGSLIYGGGLKIKLSESLNLSAELLARRTFTDYLDDVSTSYIDYNTLLNENGQMSAILANRANELDKYDDNLQLNGIRGGKNVNDYVMSGMLTISYNFVGRRSLKIFRKNKGVSCPSL